MNVQQQQQQFGDTTMTKVFVGGLAWETQKEAMREHFEKYGEILEAVIISDKITGRSKGYGFVTFKEAEAAKLACKDAAPVINGRRANCNLASLGARRPRSSTSQPGSMNGAKIVSSAPAVGSLQWYYPTGTPPPPFHPQQGIPFHAYGYSPGYFPEVAYDPKLGYCGSYVNGQFSHVYPGQGMVAQSVPVYPYFHYHHQSQGMGIPAAQIFPATTAGPITSIPAFIPKPPPTIAPNAGFWMQLKVQ